jgi:tRNA A-37 threonylcarbamoyl transferase component Bud32
MNCPHCKSPNPSDAIYCGDCGRKMVDTLAFQETSAEGLAAQRTRRMPGGPAAALAAGDEFAGRYVIAAVIGEGGMGVVYRARDKVTDRDVALKLIRADRLGGPEAVARLVREGVTSRDIRHPNVVAVYDVGEADGQPYLSMEHLAGQSLRGWIGQQMAAGAECSMAVAARIVKEILAGLEAAHAAGVVHRDLKPENVMLLSAPADDAVRLKLLDFGIARAGAPSDTSHTGLGTPRYMAPEQATAPDAVQPSADLYSLSVIFYELLVGVVPQGHWQPPSGGRRDVPTGVDDLIQKGLSNNPRSRPQSAAEYRTLLDQALAAGVKRGGTWDADGVRKMLDQAKDRASRMRARKTPAWAWWAAGAAGVAILISGLADLGGAFDAAPDYEDVRPPDDVIGGGGSLPPEPPAIDYASLGGEWHDDFQTVWSVRVSPNGQVSGRATRGRYAGGIIEGGFSGDQLQLAVQLGGTGATILGRLDGCHIRYTAPNEFGQMAQVALHIGHSPGEDCPT